MKWKASLRKTSMNGFKAQIMHWQPTGEFGGFFVRAFGIRFMVYNLGRP